MQVNPLAYVFLVVSLTLTNHAQAKWQFEPTGFSEKFNTIKTADDINRKKLPIQLQGASYFPVESHVADYLVIFDYYCSNVACSVFIVKQDKVLHELNSYGFPLEISGSSKEVNFEIVDLVENDGNDKIVTYAIMINASELKKTVSAKKPNILWRRNLIK
jgi:hypothetical protein